ncbi:MAG: tRNA 2-selenouridine(34) synthase MnmH [Burkholderiales bacterium]
MGHVQFTASNEVTVAQLDGFDELIDVRSPAEFAEDHIPGAVNHPVLNDEERDRIGKLYKHNRFEARRLGAALVAANLARHLQSFNYPARWRPLVYCWRGGKRSAAMMQVLREVGWDARRLEGGYKAYRRAVIAELATLPECFRYRVICGPTGSGKSRLLAAIHDAGGQVLDLEGLAKHRGSVLGNLPDEPQPSQKMFESRLWAALRQFKNDRPVFVEAESKKIGALTAPASLMEAVWQAECIRLETPLESRLEFLRSEYRHFFDQPELLKARLQALSSLHGKETIARWREMAEPGQWQTLVKELLEKHYDPAYEKSTLKNFARHAEGLRVRLENSDDLRPLALRLIRDATLTPSV